MLDLDGQKVSLITGEADMLYSGRLAGRLRKDRTYVVLRDLAAALGAVVGWDQQSGIVTWETDEELLHLPTRFAPYNKVGVVVTTANLRGSSPSGGTIRLRIQRAISRALKDGACTPVYVGSVAEAGRRGLSVVVVAAYRESRGSPYHIGAPIFVVGEPHPEDIHAHGTDVECQIYARTPEDEGPILKVPTITAYSPSSVAIRVGSRRSVRATGAAVLRRKAVEQFFTEINNIVLPAYAELWEQHGL